MRTILIADDSLFIRTALKDILKSGGYEVVGEAANGQQAAELYNDIRPDLVILDITMPILDGIGALKTIKVINPDAKVIMCTAMGQKTFIEEAVRYGAKDFIVKPFKPDRILIAVERILSD